jgi:uncharacterized protein (TIGR02266 family)
MKKGDTGAILGKRREKRLPRRFPVRYGVAEPRETGFIKNLSRSGVAVTGRVLFDPHIALKLLLQAPGLQVPLDGVVRWRTEELATRLGQGSMGVMFRDISDEYVRLLEQLIDQMGEHRREPRIDQELKVMFDEPRRLLDEYTQNISKGGIFVKTPEVLKENSLVQVKIVLLDRFEEVRVEGVVRFAMDAQRAQQLNAMAGMGVEFLDFASAADRERFHAYIEELKVRYHLV